MTHVLDARYGPLKDRNSLLYVGQVRVGCVAHHWARPVLLCGYSLQIPFRKEHPLLPNNLSMAKQRLLGLKRRFKRDERFHQEYASFLTDVIFYAEKVPQHQSDGAEGKVWYIVHHGVYHPRKNTLCVVFT